MKFEMPQPGVWLLTGENGAGKTTLLACLHRLGDRLAFPKYFQTSGVSDRLDDYSKSRISFSINNTKVEYSHSGKRWAPRPKKNANIVSGFGYQTVLFVAANAERVSPKPDDFGTDRIHAVPQALKDAANRIFGTNKFDNLRKVNVTRGQNQAFVFRNGSKYYSEKNFSLGELCTLKLITRILAAPVNSLVVIDELEMALHPSAQVRLYHYLNEVASDMGHTIIFSTHSVSLIKTADRSKILYLRRDGNLIHVDRKPYLSAVLGGLAYVEEKSADTVIYVEDEMAEFSARTLVNLVIADRTSSGVVSVPKIEIVPIGGFSQVVSFLKTHDALHRSSIKSFALLDLDVKEEVVERWTVGNNLTKLAWFSEYEDRIKYLPWTPEVGILSLYKQDPTEFLNSLRVALSNNQLQFSISIKVPSGQASRNECKFWLRETTEFFKQQFGLKEEDFKKALCGILARSYFLNNRPAAMQLISPMIS